MAAIRATWIAINRVAEYSGLAVMKMLRTL